VFAALVNQNAVRMHIIKQHDFRGVGGNIEHIMCFDFLCNFCLEKICHYKKKCERCDKNIHSSTRKVPDILAGF